MRIIEIKSWTVPMYGSRHTVPYGLAIVEHNGVQKTVKLGRVDQNGVTYLTFNRRRHYYKNIRSLYNPKLTFYPWDHAQSLSELTNQELYIVYTKLQADAAQLTQDTPAALELASTINMNLMVIHNELKSRTGITLP